MASRFCHIRHTLLAATTATVLETVHLRVRHLSVGASPSDHSLRPPNLEHPRSPPLSGLLPSPDPLLPLASGSGSIDLRRPYHTLTFDSTDVNPFLSLSVGSRSPGEGGKKKTKETRAERENLLNILHYMETVMPQMFDTSLYFMKYNPPQLYTPNVILENHLREPVKTSRGLLKLTFYQHLFRLNYLYRYMLRKLIILNTWIDEEEATVNIHFRVLCCRKANLSGTPPPEVDAEIQKQLTKNAEWHDFILTLHVTSHDRVWKVVITQKASDRPPKIHRPIRSLLGRLRRRLLPQPGLVPV